MPPGLIIDIGTVANPGGTVTATVAGAGSTFTVRNNAFTSKTHLVDAWRNGASAGVLEVRSPNLIDNVDGIRWTLGTELQAQLLGHDGNQLLLPQDNLTVAVTGGSSENDDAGIMTYYEDLPGCNMVLKNPGDLLGPSDYIQSFVVNTTASGTHGNFGSTVITNLYDQFRANRWMGVLGFTSDAELTAIAINGPDTSNFNCGAPGIAAPFRTRNWFADLSMQLGLPCCPCFNTANKASTNISTADDAASTTANVSIICCVMPENWSP